MMYWKNNLFDFLTLGNVFLILYGSINSVNNFNV